MPEEKNDKRRSNNKTKLPDPVGNVIMKTLPVSARTSKKNDSGEKKD